MQVTAGTRIGPYEVISRLGAGGMGVVYRARDTRLQRAVALKRLDERLQLDPGFRARLLEEARAASALNHPNICTVYDIEEHDGTSFIVMELIEGTPLDRLVPHGGLPLETVIQYGIQVAEALGHAHEHGILHRDLKPSNVVVNDQGRAKVLDFGLARRVLAGTSETATRSLAVDTTPDEVSGTLAYLAPEVLAGRPGDARSDIWALGALLYEIASGELPFRGRSTFEITTSILRDPPAPLPAEVPPGVRAIVQRCLAKDPSQRYARAGEVRSALEAIQSGSGSGLIAPRLPARRSRWKAVGVLAAVLGVGAVAGALWRGARPIDDDRVLPAQGGQLALIVSTDGLAMDPALSPDGKMVAYVGGTASQLDLFVSRVSGGSRVQLTDDPVRERLPRFSPDGERLVFTRRSPGSPHPQVCIVSSLGGPVMPIVEGGTYGTWSPDGRRLAFVQQAPGGGQVLATAAVDGSDVRRLLAADGRYPFMREPAWSPDGARIAFVRSAGGVAAEVWVVPAGGGQPTRLTADPPNIFSTTPVFSPDGRFVIHSSNRRGASNLWAAPVDGGAPVRLTTGPGPDESPSVARDGSVAFHNSRGRWILQVYTIDGGATRTVATHSSYLWGPAYSPDGRELAFSRMEADGAWHIWTLPLAGGEPRQLTFGTVPEIYPRFTPDGRSIVFNTWTTGSGRVWRIARDGGTPAAITPAAEGDCQYADVSPDGRVVYSCTNEDAQIRIAPMAGGPSRRVTSSRGTVPRVSPDGRWIAFSPSRDYDGGVWIVRPDGTDERRLTADGGWPVWWPDGTRIGYLAVSPDGMQVVRLVELRTGVSTTIDGLRLLGANHPFAVSPDGKAIAISNAVHLSDEIWVLRPKE